MKLYYYKTDVGNIGDDLNELVWSSILDFSQVKEDVGLVGFGSILKPKLDSIFETKEKIYVLGAGVRSINSLPNIDDRWDLEFLRGPISSQFLTKSDKNHITDGAYTLALHDRFEELLETKKELNCKVMNYYNIL